MKIRFISKKIVIASGILWVLLSMVGCDKSTDPQIQDHTVIITGAVRSQQTSEPLDHVYIGFKIAGIPDSVYTSGDTTVFYHSNYMDWLTKSTNGIFELNRFLGEWPPDYDNMIAYKNGFKLWTYNANTDTIFHTDTFRDSVNITMQKDN